MVKKREGMLSKVDMRTMVLALALWVLLTGCSTVPMNNLPLTTGNANTMKEVMGRNDRIILLSGCEVDRDKPILLLLHGATDDPTEMMEIVREWREKYNVLLFSYNHHRHIRKLASHLISEMKLLRREIQELKPEKRPIEEMTILTFSFSAAVFREAVLISDDKSLFSGASLIQLVPTAGGSYLARGMEHPIVGWLISLASKPSAVENPYGRIASEIWGREGTRRFYRVVNFQRMHTLIVEGDRHSLAGVPDDELQRRYRNGNGPNVVVIPKSAGVTHECLPSHPVALQYLRKILESLRPGLAGKNEIAANDH